MSGRPVRVLVVENQEDDAELVIEELRRSGFEPTWIRVDTAEDMRQALREQPWGIVLSDYIMPRFSGEDALAVLKETGLDVPFIIVSGSIGEEVAVHSLKLGAQDFFRKDRLKLLGPAVERELREAEVRRERNQAQEALRHAESERALLLDSIKEYAIFTISPEGTLTSWNPGVERVKGYKAEEFIGKPFTMLFPPEDVARGLPQAELREAAARGRYEGEGWRLRKDGKLFWAEISLTPIFTPGGQLHGFTKVTRDSTERKHLIEELRSAVRMRDEFLVIASHELRTPLTALKLQLQGTAPLVLAAARSAPEAEQLPRRFEALLRHVDRLSKLIENLLDVSRITTGRLVLQRERVDVVELARGGGPLREAPALHGQCLEAGGLRARARGLRPAAPGHGALALAGQRVQVRCGQAGGPAGGAAGGDGAADGERPGHRHQRGGSAAHLPALRAGGAGDALRRVRGGPVDRHAGGGGARGTHRGAEPGGAGLHLRGQPPAGGPQWLGSSARMTA